VCVCACVCVLCVCVCVCVVYLRGARLRERCTQRVCLWSCIEFYYYVAISCYFFLFFCVSLVLQLVMYFIFAVHIISVRCS